MISNLLPEPILRNKDLRKIFQFLFSNEKDFIIPTSLLNKLSQLSLKPQTLLAGILFFLYKNEKDFSEDLKKKIESESSNFFSEALPLYRRLNKVNQFIERPKNPKQVELTLRMFLTILADVQLLTVFLVLQIQKLEDLKTSPTNILNENAWSCLNIFAPLAGRLGIFWIKSELEDRAFRHLEFKNYQNLKKKIARKRSSRSQSVEKILSKIKSILNKEGIEHDVYGRYKRFYSIFQKLKKVNNDFERIQDLIAFRIVVKKVDECYSVLSLIHDNWTPLKNRFKDYIVRPKSNGYQSLHTTVQDSHEDGSDNSKTIEIQIRTHRMHRIAEFGVAAHWLYKEKRKESKTISKDKIEESLSKKAKLDSKKESIPIIDLFSEKIYVMTPTKEIIELPKGSTPIDFAYTIHTDVGNKTTGAKVNGKIIRLEGELKSGDIVEILTSPRQEPKKEWLELIKTRHARNKINHSLQEQNRDNYRKKGLEILEKEFKEYVLPLNRHIREGKMEHLCKHHKNQEFDHILFCIGKGTVKIGEILSWFGINENKDIKNKSQEEQKIIKKELSLKMAPRIEGNLILVDGLKNVMTRIAKCCSPSKPQPIIGYLTKEKVISVHKEMCPFLKKLKSERFIKVDWLKIK